MYVSHLYVQEQKTYSQPGLQCLINTGKTDKPGKKNTWLTPSDQEKK